MLTGIGSVPRGDGAGSPALLAAALLGCASLFGCSSPDFTAASEIDGFHLLAVQAEPPEIAPRAPGGQPARVPDRTLLTALVADRAHLGDPNRRSTVVYVACTPVPGDPSVNPCLRFEALEDPDALLVEALAGLRCGAAGAEFGTGVVGGVSYSGLEECDGSGCRPARLRLDLADPAAVQELPAPTYVLPGAYRLDVLPAGSPSLANGEQIVLVVLAIDAPPEELVPSSEPCAIARELPTRLPRIPGTRVLAVTRVSVRAPESTDEPNRNPSIPGFSVDGAAVAVDPPAVLPARRDVWLLPLLPVDADGAPLPSEIQPYTRRDAAGQSMGPAVEQWVYSWYATAGKVKDLHTKKLDAKERWTTPGSARYPMPDGGRVRLYAVVRDQRGGIAWAVRDVRVSP